MANANEVLASPQVAAAHTFAAPPPGTPQAESFQMLGSPVRLTGAPHEPTGPPPKLGDHTEAVLKERLGLSEEQLRAVLDEIGR